jgi:hypothetical protein
MNQEVEMIISFSHLKKEVAKLKKIPYNDKPTRGDENAEYLKAREVFVARFRKWVYSCAFSELTAKQWFYVCALASRYRPVEPFRFLSLIGSQYKESDL